MEKMIRHIIREELLKSINEQEIETSAFSEDEEKFLSKFIELGTDSLGIIYAPNEMGIREFLGRSGPELSLNMQVFQNLTRDKIISLVPYGGYSRNEDYTIKLNIPLQDLEGITPPADDKKQNTGGEEGEDAANMPATPTESVETSQDLAKKLVLEAKKSKKKKKSKVHTGKSRALKRLPGGYVTYLERIIQILGEKVKNDMEKEHLVADILDNLSHNFGLTPKQVYRSFIYYKSQNRLANIIKERLETDETMIKLKELLKQSTRLNLFEQTKVYKSAEMKDTFLDNYVTPNPGWKKDFDPIIKAIQDLLKQGYKLNQINVIIKSGASEAQASNRYSGSKSPKHNFVKYGVEKGGLLPPAGWVPLSGTRVGIPDGNEFLAAERGRQLKAKIEPLLKSTFPDLPANFIVIDAKLNSEKFTSYQVQTKGKIDPVPSIPTYLINGAYVIDEGGTGDGLNTRRFTGTNWPSLTAEYKIWAADPSKAPDDVLRRSNKQFGIYLTPKDNIIDLGLGPGRPVPLTKELAYELFKLKIPGRWQKSGWLNGYGGTWQDYAIEQYILAKAGKLTGTPEDIVAKNSAVINTNGTAKGYPGLEVGQSGAKSKGIQWNTMNHLQKGVPGREKTGVPSDGQGRKLQQ